MKRSILRNIASSHLVLLIVRLFAVVNGETVELTSTQGVDLDAYVTLRCSFSDGRSFNLSTVVYRHNGAVIGDDDPSFVILPKSGFASQQTLRFKAERGRNGSYTCEPNGFDESEAAIVYVVTHNPTIEIDGPQKRVLYEDSDLHVTALVRYQADTVKLWVVHNETKRVIPCSEQKERIFSNATVALKLCRLSRLDEGSIFVKGKGLLLPARNTFESQSIDVEIIRRPNSVSFTKKVGRDGWVELAWENTPTDPNHRYDPPIYYRVEWGLSMTATQFQPNISIDARNLNVSEVNVSVVAVGNYTESHVNSTRIPTGLTPFATFETPTSKIPTPFFTSAIPTASRGKPENGTGAAGVVVVGGNGLSTGEIAGIAVGSVIGVAVVAALVGFIIHKMKEYKRNCNGRPPAGGGTGNGHPVDSMQLQSVRPHAAPEPSSNASGSAHTVRRPEPTPDEQQGSSRTETENAASSDINVPGPQVQKDDSPMRRRGFEPTNTETEDTLDDLNKKIDALENTLYTKAGKKDLEKLKKDVEELKRQDKRDVKKDVEELRKNFLELQKRIPRTPEGPQAAMVNGHNSGSDTSNVALFNTYFGQHENHLIRELNRNPLKPEFLRDLYDSKLLIRSKHKLKENSKWGDQLLRYFRDTIQCERDISTLEKVFRQHYPEQTHWIAWEAQRRDQKEISDLSQKLQATKKNELETDRNYLPQHNETKIVQKSQPARPIPSSEADVDREVTDEELQRLAPKLIDRWREVSRRLPGDKESEAALETKHRSNPNELVYFMLDSWHNFNGCDATVRSICLALVRRPAIHRRAAEEVFGVHAVRQVLDSLGQ